MKTNLSPDHSFGLLGFNVIDFVGGADFGTALALAPEGKIVVAVGAWNGSRNVFGVARLLDDGALDWRDDWRLVLAGGTPFKLNPPLVAGRLSDFQITPDGSRVIPQGSYVVRIDLSRRGP
jgi:hypothetical protein